MELGVDDKKELVESESKQYRNWCLTINNPYTYSTFTDDEIESYLINNIDLEEKSLIQEDFEYCELDYLHFRNVYTNDNELKAYVEKLVNLDRCIFQRERGGNTYTEHIQMYIEFTMPKKFETIKKYFPYAHIEKREGSKQKAIEYCSKEDTRVGETIRIGDFSSINKSSVADVLRAVEEGKSNIEIAKMFPNYYIRNLQAINQYRQDLRFEEYRNKERNVEVYYIYGVAGCGKTHYVLNKYGFENVYRVTSYDKSSFDNYNGEDVIMFEEFRSGFKIGDMLNYLDKYPLMLSARYVNKVACYTKVYISSNIDLTEQYKSVQENEPETWKAFKRRIHNVYRVYSREDFNHLVNIKSNYDEKVQATLLKDDSSFPF